MNWASERVVVQSGLLRVRKFVNSRHALFWAAKLSWRRAVGGGVKFKMQFFVPKIANCPLQL